MDPSHAGAAYFGGEDWGDVWPEQPEPGCLAACLADFHPTDAEARISGLGHAYLSVLANEGIWTFYLVLVFGVALSGLATWLLVHIVQTHQLLFIVPLVPSLFLGAYCWGYITLKYRFRQLLYETVRFCCVDSFHILWRFIAASAPGILSIPGWMLSHVLVVQRPRYARNRDEATLAGGLCAECKAVVSGSRLLNGSEASCSLTWAREVWAHHTFSQLGACAIHCHLCSLLLASIQTGVSRPVNRDTVSDSPLRLSLFRRRSWKESTSTLYMRLQGKLVEDAQSLAITEVDGSRDVDGALDLPTWTTAKRWIESCICDHELCVRGCLNVTENGKSSVPSRLLEIEDPGKRKGLSSELSVRLIEGPLIEAGAFPSYIAFGQCWGELEGADDLDALFPGPETENEDHPPEFLSVGELPDLFRQAIYISSQLGFKYLWIHRLCVGRQPGEPHKEVSMVYAHAVCTVAPADCPGLSSRANCRYDDCCILKATDTTAAKHRASSTTLVCQAPKKTPERHEAEVIDEIFSHCVDEHSPNRQQPSFVERLLSRRMLFVSDGHPVFFECDTLRASPSHQLGVRYPTPSNLRGLNLAPDWKVNCSLSEIGTLNLRYTYQTRKKVIDAERGATKWETVVLPTVVQNQEQTARTMQSQLEELQRVEAWRRYRGSLHRLLRPSSNEGIGVLAEESTNDRWARMLALHEAWSRLISAYTSMGRMANAVTNNAMAGLADVASLIDRSQNGDGGVAGAVEGMWLNLLPLNILWRRAGWQETKLTTVGRTELPPPSGTPSWSWTFVDAYISHGLSDVAKNLQVKNELQSGALNRRLSYVSNASLRPGKEEIRPWTHISSLVDQFVVSAAPPEIEGVMPTPRLKLLHLCRLLHMERIQDLETVEISYDGAEWAQRPCLKVQYGLPLVLVSSLAKEVGDVAVETSWHKNIKRVVHGIIIVKEVEGEGEEYRRVGYFKLAQYKIVEGVVRSMVPRRTEYICLR